MNRLSLAHLPTPIQPLRRLGAYLGLQDLWIKRDDLTGLSFGGNKTRKLEFVIADALQQQADVIITVGGIQSNHVRQTAAVCAHLGLECRLLLSPGESETPPSGNLFLNHLFGASVRFCPSDQREALVAEEIKALAKEGKKAYYLPLGASTPIGGLAYASAFEECLVQDAGFDLIVVASGSGGTQAGLHFGAEQFNWAGMVLGVSILFPEAELRNRIERVIDGMQAIVDQSTSYHRRPLQITDGFLSGGYGVMGKLEREAILLFARQEGILLDPVYTGRAAGAMLQLLADGELDKRQRILFWHTGGTPALFCERYRNEFYTGVQGTD